MKQDATSPLSDAADQAAPRSLEIAQAGHAADPHAAEAHGQTHDTKPADAHAEAHDAHAAKPADAHAEGHAEAHDAHAADGHAAAHDSHAEHGEAAGYKMPGEFPNIYTLTEQLVNRGHAGHHGDHGHHKSVLQGPFAVHGPFWVNPLFAFTYASIFLVIVVRIMARRSVEAPSKAQVALELLFGGLYDFFKEVLGGEKNARKYVPFVGSVFLFIWLANFCGLIPLMKSPTAHFWTAFGVALCTFFYVNYNGVKEAGLFHTFAHLCGSPEGFVGWIIGVVIIFPLEIVGTFVKPISLALRLSGNIFGEDKLLAAFMGMGVGIATLIMGQPVTGWGLPLHLPFLFLGTLTCLIQALVFSLLSAVYIALMLPHDDHHADDHGHGHGHEAHGAHAGAHH